MYEYKSFCNGFLARLSIYRRRKLTSKWKRINPDLVSIGIVFIGRPNLITSDLARAAFSHGDNLTFIELSLYLRPVSGARLLPLSFITPIPQCPCSNDAKEKCEIAKDKKR